MNKKWSLYNISESRGILMGVATLIVAFFHCYSYHFDKIFTNDFLGRLFNFLRSMGNIGVDVFLFLSAIGLYFSFSKDSNLKNFYKKRVLRIVPSIIIVASIYYLYKGVSVNTFFKGITLFSFYLDGVRDFWYFALIIVLYILYPLFHKIIEKKDLLGLIALLLISIGSTILLMNTCIETYNKLEIALTRVPVFLLGVYTGKQVLNKKEIHEISIIIFLLLFIICNYLLFNFKFNPYIYVRYIYCLLGISIVFLVTYLHSKIRFEYSDKFLTFMGTYSMEVYLIFEKLSVEVRKLSYVTVHNNFVFYTLMFIITMILSFLLKKLCNLITNIKIKK